MLVSLLSVKAIFSTAPQIVAKNLGQIVKGLVSRIKIILQVLIKISMFHTFDQTANGNLVSELGACSQGSHFTVPFIRTSTHKAHQTYSFRMETSSQVDKIVGPRGGKYRRHRVLVCKVCGDAASGVHFEVNPETVDYSLG